MSKFNIELSYKNIKILKHSLEKRIDIDKGWYEIVKKIELGNLTEKGKQNIKEHEEHLRCLEELTVQMKCVGYMHGKNVFGSKYE